MLGTVPGVTSTPPSTPSKPTVTSGSQVSICTDFNSLLEALNVDIAAAGIFEGGYINAKCSMVKDLQFASYSVAVVVYSSQDTTTNATNVQLTPQALAIAPNSSSSSPSALTFFKKYEDSYVSQITVGGYYAAVYMFHSESQSEQESVSLALKAKGVFDGGAISGSFSTKLSQSMQQAGTKTSSHQSMVGGPLVAGTNNPVPFPSSTDVAGMIAYAAIFPTAALAAPAVVGFQSTGYEIGNLASGTAWNQVVCNRQLFLANTPSLLSGLSGIMAWLNTVMDMVNDIQATYTTYNYTGDTTLPINYAQMKTDLAAAQVLLLGNPSQPSLSYMAGDPTQTYTIPKYQSVTNGEPNLNFTVPTYPPLPVASFSPNGWGGSGGKPFNDVVVVEPTPPNLTPQDFVVEGQYIQSITIWGDKWINALQVAYANPSGLQPTVTTVTHGTVPKFASCGTLTLAPGEIITAVTCNYGADKDAAPYTHQLIITTSRGQTYTAPPNPFLGSFTVSYPPNPPNPGQAIFGLSGACALYLDAIAFVTATFSPAIWTPPVG